MATGLFVTFPNGFWLSIASFICSPDAYNICWISLRFKSLMTSADELKLEQGRVMVGKEHPVLAKLIMRASFFASLRKLLLECTSKGTFSLEPRLETFPTE